MADLDYQINAILNDVNINDVNAVNLKNLKYQQLQRYVLYRRFFNTYIRNAGIGNFQRMPPQLELLLQHLFEKTIKSTKFNEIELEKKIFDNLEVINH